MITTVLSFLGSPIGRIVGIVLAIISVAGMAWGMLQIHDAGVRNEALAKFNEKQLKQVIEDQRKFTQLQQEIKASQEKIIEDLNKQNREVISKYTDIEKKLKSADIQKDSKPLSPKLQELYNSIKNGAN